MGLAEPRKHIKISHDPNNIQWASSNNAFGHRILRRQGWSPGSGLGARHATHVSASTINIKITYKDDNLGLGARIGGQDNNPSSDAFAGLLGRLNGKDADQLTEEERKRGSKRLERYVMGKWGTVLFVRGGLLVQDDDFKEGTDAKMRDSRTVEEENVDSQAINADEKALKKAEKAKRRLRREERRRRKDGPSTGTEESASTQAHLCENGNLSRETLDAKTARREERRRRKAARKSVSDEVEIITEPPSMAEMAVSDAAKELDKSFGKLPPKSVKRKRRKEKEMNPGKASKNLQEEPRREESDEHSSSLTENAGSSTTSVFEPSASQSSTPKTQVAPFGRHAIRGRHIAQKKAAFLDESSLKGIFTVKAQ